MRRQILKHSVLFRIIAFTAACIFLITGVGFADNLATETLNTIPDAGSAFFAVLVRYITLEFAQDRQAATLSTIKSLIPSIAIAAQKRSVDGLIITDRVSEGYLILTLRNGMELIFFNPHVAGIEEMADPSFPVRSAGAYLRYQVRPGTGQRPVSVASVPERPAGEGMKEMVESLSRSMATFIYEDEHNELCVEAGRPHFHHQEWGRDTMISLLGIISAGWYKDAEKLLIKWAGWEKNGIIPNVKGWAGSATNDNTSDAALWFIEAVYQYIKSTGSNSILEAEVSRGKKMADVMRNVMARYSAVTNEDNIHGDAETGFVYVPKQSTMMDTKYTPRQGYPVEIQALWYNALLKMARMDAANASAYNERAGLVKRNFEKYFWNPNEATVYDILGTDGPKSPAAAVPDPSVRFNQILTVYFRLAEGETANKIIRSTMDRLRLPGALRSLAVPTKVYRQIRLGDGRIGWETHEPRPGESAGWPFAEFYPYYETGADREVRDKEYHNGTGWVWIYPFLWVSAVQQGAIEKGRAIEEMRSDYEHLMRDAWTGGSWSKLGSLPECTDGSVVNYRDKYGRDYLYAYPKACGEQAWSVSGAIWGFENILGADTIRPVSGRVRAEKPGGLSEEMIAREAAKTAGEITTKAGRALPPDLERERNIAADFMNVIMRMSKDAGQKGQSIILGLDESWILNKSCPQAMIQEIERLPYNLRKLGLDNVIFVRGKGDEVAIDIQGKQRQTNTSFSNIIILGSTSILRSAEFDKLKSSKAEDSALLIGVDTKYMTPISGIRILEMYLLAMRLNSAIAVQDLDMSFIKVTSDPAGRPRAFVFTPVEPYDIEQFRTINRIQIEQIDSQA